jgi:ABC-type iron transport system FetAB permease component
MIWVSEILSLCFIGFLFELIFAIQDKVKVLAILRNSIFQRITFLDFLLQRTHRVNVSPNLR